jgi:hypothetical protein
VTHIQISQLILAAGHILLLLVILWHHKQHERYRAEIIRLNKEGVILRGMIRIFAISHYRRRPVNHEQLEALWADYQHTRYGHRDASADQPQPAGEHTATDPSSTDYKDPYGH